MTVGSTPVSSPRYGEREKGRASLGESRIKSKESILVTSSMMVLWSFFFFPFFLLIAASSIDDYDIASTA